MSLEYTELGTVVITSIEDAQNGVGRMEDVQGTYLSAGRKNEVLAIARTESNTALKTGRQLFAKVPGVFVYDMDGSGNQINIATRGLDPHRSWEMNIRQNGVITNSDMYGYPASHFSPPMESIDHVDIVRGTAALQYGAQFGGMIDYVTKAPDTTKPLGFETINTIGSFGLLSTYNAVSGRSGKWTYQAYFSKRVAKGYRQSSESDGAAHMASLTYRGGKNWTLRAEYARSTYTYHEPGPLSDAMFAQDPLQATRLRNWFSPDIHVPSLRLDSYLGHGTWLQVTASALLGTRSSVQFIGTSDVRDTINLATGQYKPRQVDIDRFNSRTVEARIRKTMQWGVLSTTLVAGLQYMDNDLNRRQLGKGTTGSDYDLTLSQPGWGRDLHFKTRNIAFFAEDLIRFSQRFSVSPGLRLEKGATNMSGTISYYEAAKIPLRIEHVFPLFGITSQYLLPGNGRLYAGIGQSYRPMIFKDVIPASSIEVIDPNLRDAHGYTAELGWNQDRGGRWHHDVSVYLMDYRDRIGAMVLQDATGKDYSYKTNVGNTLTYGVEVYLEAVPWQIGRDRSLSLFTSSSWLHGKYTRGIVPVKGVNTSVAGNRIESAPEWTTRNGARLRLKGFALSVLYSYVGMTYSDPLNTPVATPNGSKGPVPGYGLVDIDLSWKIMGHVTFKAGINNLFDKKYFTKRPTFYPDPGIWPSDGRAIYASIAFKI
jgi:Fe(3+) dicitrate transport protein